MFDKFLTLMSPVPEGRQRQIIDAVEEKLGCQVKFPEFIIQVFVSTFVTTVSLSYIIYIQTHDSTMGQELSSNKLWEFIGRAFLSFRALFHTLTRPDFSNVY